MGQKDRTHGADGLEQSGYRRLSPLVATAMTRFGAAEHFPGFTAIFSLSPYLIKASHDQISNIRRDRWDQRKDEDFLMGAFRAEAERRPRGQAGRFMQRMAYLITGNVDEVCWSVSVPPEVADSWMIRNLPHLLKKDPNLTDADGNRKKREKAMQPSDPAMDGPEPGG